MKIFGSFVGLCLIDREIQGFREPLAPSWRAAGAHSTVRKEEDSIFSVHKNKPFRIDPFHDLLFILVDINSKGFYLIHA